MIFLCFFLKKVHFIQNKICFMHVIFSVYFLWYNSSRIEKGSLVLSRLIDLIRKFVNKMIVLIMKIMIYTYSYI